MGILCDRKQAASAYQNSQRSLLAPSAAPAPGTQPRPSRGGSTLLVALGGIRSVTLGGILGFFLESPKFPLRVLRFRLSYPPGFVLSYLGFFLGVVLVLGRVLGAIRTAGVIVCHGGSRRGWSLRKVSGRNPIGWEGLPPPNGLGVPHPLSMGTAPPDGSDSVLQGSDSTGSTVTVSGTDPIDATSNMMILNTAI